MSLSTQYKENTRQEKRKVHSTGTSTRRKTHNKQKQSHTSQMVTVSQDGLFHIDKNEKKKFFGKKSQGGYIQHTPGKDYLLIPLIALCVYQ